MKNKNVASKSLQFFALTFAEGINVLLGFLFLPYLSRALSVSDYGTYGQVLMLLTLLQGIFALGLSKMIFVYLANDQYPARASFAANVAASLMAGVVAVFFLWLLAPFVAVYFENTKLPALVNIGAWMVPAGMLSASLNATLIYYQRVKQSAIISVVCNLLKIIGVVLAIQYYASLSLVFAVLVGVEVIRSSLFWRSLPHNLSAWVKPSWSLIKLQIKAGWPLGITALLGVAFYSIDGYMVSALLDVEQYAIYRNGAFQLPFISSIYGAVAAILLPDVSRLFFKQQFQEIVALKKKASTNTAMLIFPPLVFCIVFAEPLITTYLSEAYRASYPIFMLYNLILLLRFSSYDDLFIASQNNRKMPPIYLGALLLNILLNSLLIPSLGALGAALASVCSFYLLVSLLLYKGTKLIKASMLAFFDVGKLVKVLLLSLGLSGVFYVLFVYWGKQLWYVWALLYFLLLYDSIIRWALVDRAIVEQLLAKAGENNVVLRLFNYCYPPNNA